tara:strand:+ start:6953 stop:9325 length:2373 start_codon:yes stop_codon:yes gene_type:complete
MSTTIIQTAVANTLSADLKIVKTECFDADIMEVLCRDKRFSASNRRMLSAYKKGRTHANEVEVVYHHQRGMETLRMGRLFPRNNLGLQSFPHDIRNPLLDKYYWDVDMENAHYVFMIKIAERYNVRNDAIKYYVNNRDACLRLVSDVRRTAKTAYLKTGYGGDVKLYKDFYNDDGIEPEGNLTQVKEVEAEILPLITAIWNDPVYKDIKKLACIKNRNNPKFSLFALVLQTEECRCLTLIDAYLKTQNRSMDVYIHDGGEVRKLPNETQFPPSLLRGAEEYVLGLTEHKIKLVVKPMEHNYSLPPTTGMIVVEDDLDACIKLKKLYGDRIVRAIDSWYVNMPETKCYEQGEEFVKNLIMIANVRKSAATGGTTPYGTNATGCNNIFKMLCSAHTLYPVNKEFINEVNVATKDKLFFEDKYWDFKLRQWFDIDEVIPLVYIKRPAPDFTDITQEEIADFISKVLNVFANAEDRNLYLRAIARGLSGNTSDKVWYIIKGMRDCGKSLLQDMGNATFKEYISVFEAPMMRSNNSGDASERRWVLTSQAHIKRIAFSNETKDIVGKAELVMDGNEIKKVIASGGDGFSARCLFKDEVFISNNTTAFMSMNKIPSCNPPDAMNTMILFDMPYKFVEESLVDDDIMYRKADPTIKDQIKKNTRWADIFLHLIFQNYTDMPVVASDMNEISKAECGVVIKASNATNPIALFNSAFKKDDEGWVSSADIKRILAPAKLSDVKFSSFLKTRGFVQKRGTLIDAVDEFGNPVTINGKVKKVSPQGYSGLSFKEIVDECSE